MQCLLSNFVATLRVTMVKIEQADQVCSFA